MCNYVILSLETHAFFARIMKEHSFFLEAGFPCKDTEMIQEADRLRMQFEELLADVIRLADGRVHPDVLNSQELATEFTIPAERQTASLSGVPFDSQITAATLRLRPMRQCRGMEALQNTVNDINCRAIRLLDELITLKEAILNQVSRGNLFTFNYPLLLEHVLREARLYREIIQNLMENHCLTRDAIQGTEAFWNQIMMEHALFIRGLLDPSEAVLIETADDFAGIYRRLLATARNQDAIAVKSMQLRSIKETLKYRDFKSAATQGILNNQIRSIIIPLLADHVLREANHYLRILQD